MAPPSHNPWLIAVDTGGTFTDAVARDPGGVIHRAKILSSSAIGATLVEVLDKDRLRLDLADSFPNDFFVGFTLRDAEIVAFDAANAIVTLKTSPVCDAPWRIGAAVSLQSPEEAPVLAARIIGVRPARIMRWTT